MSDYNKTQNDYREGCKNRIQRQLEITGKKTTSDELEQMLDSDNPNVFSQQVNKENNSQLTPSAKLTHTYWAPKFDFEKNLIKKNCSSYLLEGNIMRGAIIAIGAWAL